MTEKYSREILKRNVAQICQTIGWNGINSTPMDILVHILEKYIRTLGTQANRYAEQFNRTEPNLHDLGLVFQDLHVHMPELVEYARCVPPIQTPVSLEKFPKPKESNLNFLKPGSHEVVTRPMHVHEHLPPMFPEKEKEQTPPVADTIEIRQNGHDSLDKSNLNCTSPEISVTDSPEKQKDLFKRPTDPVSLPSKRPRLRLEEEECHTREISSVMMTMSGFLSPAREGKLPEARTPTIISDRHPDKHKANSHHSNLMKVPSIHASIEKNEKRSKKSKLLNGKIVKNKKKDKSHKNENNKGKLDGKVDRVPPTFPPKSKEVPTSQHNHVTMAVPRPVPPTPILENIRPIKQEPPDNPPSPLNKHFVSPSTDSIPIPRKIPISKSPLVPNASPAPVPKPLHVASTAILPPIEIKKEVMDEEEKLASQPDRSKINIFKRISNKVKDDKTISEVVTEKSHSENFNSRTAIPLNIRNEKNKLPESNLPKANAKPYESLNNNMEATAINLSKEMDLTTNEVINIDDDSLDINLTAALKSERVGTSTGPLDVNKTKHLPYPKDMVGVSPKIKKERKHKEKKDKLAEKTAKMNAKLIKKHQQFALGLTPHGDKNNYNFPNAKAPKLGRPPKHDASKLPQLPPGFPFFPSLPPGRGMLPGPGLIPKPGLIPGGDLFSGLHNNPALRGMHPPNLLANPFALRCTGPGLMPDFSPGNCLIPPGLPNHLLSMGGFGQSSRSQQPRSLHPLLRRPSLEVIPVENEEERHPQKSFIPSPIREKEKHDKHKMSSIPNILQKHSSKSRIPKESPPKQNLYKMPPVQPDITIELNPPSIKTEPVKAEAVKQEPIIETQPVVAPRQQDPIQETTITEVQREKIEKKKDKLHKKEKRDKEGLKIKKKKDKKDKSKEKSEKRKEKDDKQEVKDKLKKDKKEKKKDKEKVPPVDGLVPKLTLKLGSSSPMPPSSPEVFKLNIKPVVKKEVDPDPVIPKEERVSPEPSHSPELAQISALVTRPPKPKQSSKHNNATSDSPGEIKAVSPPPQSSNSSPPRKNRPPSSHSKYKRIYLKPLAKKSGDQDDSLIQSIPEEQPPKIAPPADQSTPIQLTTPYYTDEHGNKVWVCPACGRPDNGSPMIGCDGCDGWYHWVCVGITVDPGDSEDWFCRSCIAKRAAMVTALAGVQTGKKRGRKPKTDKVRDGH